MNLGKSLHLTREKIARMLADVVMINFALVAAFTIRFIYLIVFEDPQGDLNHSEIFWDYIGPYIHCAWVLTIISLVTFSLNGFYSYRRAYRGRYKAFVVVQAVSLAYLVFGFTSDFVGAIASLPRSVLILSWVLSAVLLVSARLCSIFWRKMVRMEEKVILSTPSILPNLKDRKILVIGGAGYIGSALLPQLLDLGYHVRLLDMLLYSTDPINNVIDHPNLEIMNADFRQVDKVVEAMHGVQSVIHLGAIVGDPACDLDEELTIEVNLMATRMIAEVAKGCGIQRFIFASTCSVYGANEEILDEHSKLAPVSLYAKSKIASEKVLLKMATPNFTPVILRFATIFGLSGRPRFDLVVNLLTAKAMLEGRITVFSGSQYRPFLHVSDAALSVVKVLEASVDAIRNQIFNVGSNKHNYTINEVAEMIQKLVPASAIVDMGDDSDRRNYKVSFDKIFKALNYQPELDVDYGIRQIVEAIQSGLIRDYTDVKYSNVKFLSEESNSRLIQSQNGWAYDLIKEAATPSTPQNQ